MKAVRLYAKQDLRVEDIAAPGAVPDGWVKLKVDWAGICGSDIHNFRTGQWITRAPSVAGHEFTGTILELGQGVEDFTVGERVVADSRYWCGDCDACKAGRHQLCAKLGFVGEACDGGFAEETLLPARLLLKTPAGLDPHVAATAEPFAVALHAVNRLRLRKGEPVLVLGCGPIGGFAAVVLAHLGLGPVLVSDRNEARARLVAEVTGAEAVAFDALDASKLAAAIDATGSVAALKALLGLMPGGSSIALVGISHGTLDLDPNLLVEREISLIGCHAFEDEMPAAITMLQPCAPQILRLIDSEVPLDQVPQAYARIIGGACTGLKVLIRI